MSGEGEGRTASLVSTDTSSRECPTPAGHLATVSLGTMEPSPAKPSWGSFTKANQTNAA